MSDAARDMTDAELPEVLGEIRRIAGTAAMLTLVNTWGGTTQHFPREHDPTHPLVALIGHEAAAALMQHFNGGTVYIPKMHAAVIATRNAEIAARHEGGLSVHRLALDYALTERQIWNILARTPRERPQNDLFGSGSD